MTLAARKACTPPRKSPWPGTRRMARLQDNLGALAVHLQADEWAELNHALQTLSLAGARCIAESMKGVGAWQRHGLCEIMLNFHKNSW